MPLLAIVLIISMAPVPPLDCGSMVRASAFLLTLTPSPPPLLLHLSPPHQQQQHLVKVMAAMACGERVGCLPLPRPQRRRW